MFQLKDLLLALGLLSMVAVVRCEFEGGFAFAQSTYNQLNHYLKSVRPTDQEAAIGQLTQLLHSEQEKAQKPMAFNRLRIKALTQIIQLAQVSNSASPVCDESALQIQIRNEQAIGNIFSRVDTLASKLRPIDDLVLYFSLEHAKACENVYPELLATKIASLNKSNIGRVERLLGDVVKSQVEHELTKDPEKSFNKAVYDAFIRHRYLVSAKKDAPVIYSALKEASKSDPENKYLGFGEDENIDLRYLHDKSGKHLLKKYLIQPCEYYFKELGKGVLEPALHDLRLQQQVGEGKEDFYRALALYELCGNIISTPSALTKSVEYLAELNSCENCDLED